MATYKVIAFMCLVGFAIALPAQDETRGARNAIQTESDLLDAVHQDCLRKDSLSCVKYKLFSFVDRMLGAKDSIAVTEGVQIVKSEGAQVEEVPRALTGDETIETLIINRIGRFLNSHTIKIDLKGSEIVNVVSNTARSLSDTVDSLTDDDDNEVGEEGRGKKKKVLKMFGPIMALAAMKAAFIGKIAIAAIALLAGKALLVGKIALVLSAIIALKKLFGGQGKHVSYEVVAHPTHTSSHVSSHEAVHGGGGYGGDFGGYSGGSSGHGGWGRSLDGQQLAYRGHTQQ